MNNTKKTIFFTFIALADIAWKPNDNEMKNTTFDDYNWCIF